jgi:hypothetical protein
MATLENRSGKYRVIFYFDGQRFSRSLKTKCEQAAIASVALAEEGPSHSLLATRFLRLLALGEPGLQRAFPS